MLPERDKNIAMFKLILICLICLICLLPFQSFAKEKIVVKDKHGKIIETIKPYDEKRGIYKVYDSHGKVKQTIKIEKGKK